MVIKSPLTLTRRIPEPRNALSRAVQKPVGLRPTHSRHLADPVVKVPQNTSVALLFDT